MPSQAAPCIAEQLLHGLLGTYGVSGQNSLVDLAMELQ
jgi:hypothetical protein